MSSNASFQPTSSGDDLQKKSAAMMLRKPFVSEIRSADQSPFPFATPHCRVATQVARPSIRTGNLVISWREPEHPVDT